MLYYALKPWYIYISTISLFAQPVEYVIDIKYTLLCENDKSWDFSVGGKVGQGYYRIDCSPMYIQVMYSRAHSMSFQNVLS